MEQCKRCGLPSRQFEVHHVNHIHADNRPSNRERICRTCHLAEHGANRAGLLKRWRGQSGISLDRLAMRLGVHSSQCALWENGGKPITDQTERAWVQALRAEVRSSGRHLDERNDEDRDMQFTRKSDFELHPEGVFEADFVEWAEEYSETFSKEQIKLTFDSEEEMDDGKPYRISKWVSASLHPKSGMYGFLKAVGIDPDVIDEDTDVAEVLDEIVESPRRRMQIVVKHYEGKDKSQKHKISDFLPLKKKGKRTAEPETSGDRAAAAEPAPEPVAAGGKRGKLWNKDEE